MRDIVESQDRLERLLRTESLDPLERLQDFFGFREIFRELNLDVSPEELLSAETTAFTYADLYAMLRKRNTVLWITPYTAIAKEEFVVDSWGRLDESRCTSFNVDGKGIVVLARSPQHSFEICDVVLRLLAASAVHTVILPNLGFRGGSINATSLAFLMEQCQSLHVLSLYDLDLDENHCRVLGVYSRPGLEIALTRCKLTSDGISALAEVLGRNQGPTKLEFCEFCDIDNSVLADGLRGNSHLKSLSLWISSTTNLEVDNREGVAIAGALRENKGLVELKLGSYWVSDETWDAVCDSLKTNPTLEVLQLVAPAVLESRIQALVNMVKVNMSIHIMSIHIPIHLDSCYSEHELFRGSIIPYLDTNRLRPRLLAIQKTSPIAYRAKVLGRALLSARTDPNRFWMLLSGNAEVVAFSSTTAPTTDRPTFANFCRRFYKCCRSEQKLSLQEDKLSPWHWLPACRLQAVIGYVFVTASGAVDSLR
jgi:hypothetical protein